MTPIQGMSLKGKIGNIVIICASTNTITDKNKTNKTNTIQIEMFDRPLDSIDIICGQRSRDPCNARPKHNACCHIRFRVKYKVKYKYKYKYKCLTNAHPNHNACCCHIKDSTNKAMKISHFILVL